MRVLFLLPDFVLPTESGLRVRELSQLRLMNAIDEIDSIRILTVSGVDVPEVRLRELEAMFSKVTVEQPIIQPLRIRQSRKQFRHFLIRRFIYGEPYLAAMTNCKPMHDLLATCLQQNRYDIVYLSSLSVSSYLDTVRRYSPGSRVVLEQHNVEWRIFDRLASDLTPPMNHVARVEAQALRLHEARVMGEVDAVIAISQIDAAELNEMAGIKSIVVPTYFELPPPREADVENLQLGYIGHLGWQPNTIGLDWFCKDVWSLVREKLPDARLTVAGPGLEKDANGNLIAPELWRQSGIDIVGFVDDLNDLYAQTCAMVAPVIGGSGVRMKLLETMSAGMPTVTTPDGALGLNVTDGRELLFAQDAQGFADRVVRILSDKQLRTSLRKHAYSFVTANHSKEAAIEQLKHAIFK